MTCGDLFSFGPYLLDTRARCLKHGDEVVPMAERYLDLLSLFVSRPGQLLSKDALTDAAWPDVVVTPHSLEQAIWVLRKTLTLPSGQSCIETKPRLGYRFVAEVSQVERRESDAVLV